MKTFFFFFSLSLATSLLMAQVDTPGASQNGQPNPALTPPSDNPKIPASSMQPPNVDSPPSAPAQPSAREIARLQQQEVLRRQELTYKANQATAEGQKAELAQDYPKARQYYSFAADSLSSISRRTISYVHAAEGLTRVDLAIYHQALDQGDTKQALEVLEEAAKYNPGNAEVAQKLDKLNKSLNNPNNTTMLGNPALNPAFVKKVNEVEELFAEAEQFRRTGQWDLAEARLNRILGLDPYNRAATQKLQQIEAQKLAYDEEARKETRDERLRQVEENWYTPIQNPEIDTGVQAPQPDLVRTTNFSLEQGLKSIMLTLKFDNVSIEDAADYLTQQSKQLDPNGKGVTFIVQPDVAGSANRVNLTLNNPVPLGDALRYICQIAGVKYKIQDYGISIIPFSANSFDLIRQTFTVQPNFFTLQSEVSTGANGTNGTGGAGPDRPLANPLGGTGTSIAGADDADSAQSILEKKGIKFPAGSSAVYTRSNQQLTVINTADQMEFIEELVNAGNAPTLMVRISSKMVEINQEDISDFTVNSYTNMFGKNSTGNGFTGTAPIYENSGANPNNGTPYIVPVKTPTYNTGLRGANGFQQNSISSLLAQATGTVSGTSENFLSLKAMVGPIDFGLLFTALSQKTSFDLLSEPSVMTKSGEQAMMEAVRDFPYPTAFQKPQTITQTATTSQTLTIALEPPTVIPSFPTEFSNRKVGVRLVAHPIVTPDNKNIDISLSPEVVDFQGFINYGSPIFISSLSSASTDASATSTLLSQNAINQPVFNTRRINARVIIHDGSTLILGGLMREDIQDVTDKVPILGDLPLIGRLFQSKAKQSIKRNLIIFVTANIYRNDGELLNPPEETNAVDVLTQGTAPVNP